MTRDELRTWLQKETEHCRTFEEMVDETVRFIITNFKKRSIAVVVETKPLEPQKKVVNKVVKKIIKRAP